MPPLPRPDGELVRGVHPVRRFMPFILPTRTESHVLYKQQVEVSAAKAFLARLNESRPKERPATLFHLLLRTLATVLTERPRMNRFVAGGRLYQRDGAWISFSGKRSMADDAPIYTSKRRFEPEETFEEMLDAVYSDVRFGREGRESTSDKEVGLLLRLPGPALRIALAAVRLLNNLNLIPASMIASDPLFSSLFVANLGSVGIDACYHHNYEYGTISIFVVMGRVHVAPVATEEGTIEAREVFEIKYTYDERIEDGFNAARALERIKYLLEHPEEL